jgi:serine/threonine-protein kinase
MLTQADIAKVLDFGLAKTNQSTMLTRMGSTLGTVAYMSPEQARGHEVDGRTDLYSLGTVLYEMVAGRLPFAGDYEQAVLYGIMNEPPEPLTALRTGVPLELERVVAKLLSKEAEYRYQTAADLLADLKRLDVTGSGHTRRSMASVSAVDAAAATPERRAAPGWFWGIAVACLLVGFVAAWFLAPGSGRGLERYPTVRSEIHLGDGRIPQAMSISRDGSLLAYSDAATGAVFVRNLASGEERLIPDTQGIIELDFSPEGQWLLLDEQQGILRASVSGGSPVRLRSLQSNAPHSSWVDNERILFDDESSIWMMSIADGKVTPVVTADSSASELRLLWGRVSPDGSRLFARIIRDPDTPMLGIYSFPDGEVIAKHDWDAVSPRYMDTGHLLLLDDSDLMARPIDLASGQFLGAPVRVAESISETNWDLSTWGQLVHGPITSFQFSSSSAVVPTVTLGRASDEGTVEPLPFPEGRYANLRVSPDGRRLAAEVYDPGAAAGDVWVLDLETGIREQLTFDNTGQYPAWSPDGDSILVTRRLATGRDLAVLAADGSGMPRIVARDSLRLESPDWSETAGLIAVVLVTSSGSRDIWFVEPYFGEKRPAVESASEQSLPVFSPNGRYFAFESNQRILVRTTSLDGGEWDISQGTGETPRWSPDGKSLYFANGGDIRRVPVDTEGRFRRLGPPETVLSTGSTALYFAPVPHSEDLIFVTPKTELTSGTQVPVQIITNAPALIDRMAPRPR